MREKTNVNQEIILRRLIQVLKKTQYSCAAAIIFLAMAGLGLSAKAQTPQQQNTLNNGTNVGKSGLPLPRFVSLRSNRINVRIGPDKNAHAVAWTYLKQGLPVEIIEEYDNWRRIRDSDGDGGWVDQAFLSGKRTAMPAPWADASSRIIRKRPDEASAPVAEIEAGVIGELRQCRQGWCRLEIKTDCDLVESKGQVTTSPLPQFLSNLFSFGTCAHNYRGWIKQADLWGVYPDEEF